jgi:hypothetical protein
MKRRIKALTIAAFLLLSQTSIAVYSQTPGSTAELRQCIASGRSTRICFSEGMGNGFEQMIGISMKQPVPAGFRMTGDYAGTDGFRLIFEPETVTVICRGVPSPRPYTVRLSETDAVITIQNDPKPIPFSLRADGKLAGSGPIRVTGQVPAGTRTEQTIGTTSQTTTTTRELTPLEARNYPNAVQNGSVYTIKEDATELVYGPTGTRTVTQFVNKTADCTMGLLSPTGASPLPLLKNDFDILTALGTGMGALMKGANVQDAANEMLSPGAAAPAPGLRLSGNYGADTGFSLNFHRESVTLGCGEAEQALEYSIQRTGNKTTLTVKGNPTAFQVMPDASVVGEGTVQVNGRVVTGTTDDMDNPFKFAPLVARCSVGRLVAGASAPKTPTPVSPAAPAAPPAPDAGRTPSTNTSTLKITAAPSVASALAGKALMILKESLEDVLAKGGLNAQPGTSSRISTWSRACERGPADAICQQGINALGNSIVARTGFDANGVATFSNVPSSGTFWIGADTGNVNHRFWNVRVDLKPGANSVTLDERNMTPLDR